jgi:hypothetical protein
MEVVAMLVIVGGLGYALVVWQQKASRAAAATAAAGRLIHLRSAAFPATCSWCKNTSLAHRLLVFEHTDERWRPFDVRDGLAATADHALEDTVAAIFERPGARWRRFCTEKCSRDFFAAAHVEAVAPFGACAHCDTRFPTTLVHCPHCGAPRRTS